MTAEHFEALVRRLEAVAQAHPRAYRLRVACVAALGYAYILLVLAILLALLIAIGFVLARGRNIGALAKPAFWLLMLVVAIGRALWVRVDPPRGRALSRAEAPKLFERLDAIGPAIGAPRVDDVLATSDVNAAVVQVPRLGIFGWQRNVLMLGVPFMRALSASEFEAVIAHELGHLSGAHGRFTAWIYRLRMSWARLLDVLEQRDSVGTFVFRGFARRYAPYFNAYSFVLARVQELEADRASASFAGARVAADALVRTSLVGGTMQAGFWSAVSRRIRTMPEPPPEVFVNLGNGFEGFGRTASGADGRIDADRQVALASALETDTTLDDTHPCLRDRLAALGEPARLPDAMTESAASALLGERAVELERELSREWHDAVAEDWRRQHAEARAVAAEIAQLEQTASPSIDEEWRLACLLSNEDRPDEAFRRLERVLERDPEHGGALRTLAMHRLAEGDEAGLRLAERALARDAYGTIELCNAAVAFLRPRGREAEAETWTARASAHSYLLTSANAERSYFDSSQPVLPHGLPDERLDGLREQLRAHPDVRRAYLLRKQVEVMPEQPCWVLAIERGRDAWLASRGAKLQRRLVEQIQLSGTWFCLMLDESPRRNRKRIREVAGAPFYEAHT